MPRLAPLHALATRLRDPFGFHAAFADLHIAPDDLPCLTRERRLEGAGS